MRHITTIALATAATLFGCNLAPAPSSVAGYYRCSEACPLDYVCCEGQCVPPGSSLCLGETDAGAVDGGLSDAGLPDAGSLDAGPSDAGAPDAGPIAPDTVSTPSCTRQGEVYRLRSDPPRAESWEAVLDVATVGETVYASGFQARSSAGGAADAFVSRLDVDRCEAWRWVLPGAPAALEAVAVAADETRVVVVVRVLGGSYAHEDFTPALVDGDSLVVALDPEDGAQRWSVVMRQTAIEDVARASGGVAYLAGHVDGPDVVMESAAACASEVRVSGSGGRGVVARIDADTGCPTWAESDADESDTHLEALAVLDLAGGAGHMVFAAGEGTANGTPLVLRYAGTEEAPGGWLERVCGGCGLRPIPGVGPGRLEALALSDDGHSLYASGAAEPAGGGLRSPILARVPLDGGHTFGPVASADVQRFEACARDATAAPTTPHVEGLTVFGSYAVVGGYVRESFALTDAWHVAPADRYRQGWLLGHPLSGSLDTTRWARQLGAYDHDQLAALAHTGGPESTEQALVVAGRFRGSLEHRDDPPLWADETDGLVVISPSSHMSTGLSELGRSDECTGGAS